MREEIVRSTSAWSAREIELFLVDARIPVRLACLSASGSPLLCSLWFRYSAGAIWCATPRSARLVAWLQRDPRCAFEIAGDRMPYRGVRGQGKATLSSENGPETLRDLIDRYLGTRESGFARWLLARQDDETAIRIQPDWITSWNFSSRMAGSGDSPAG